MDGRLRPFYRRSSAARRVCSERRIYWQTVQAWVQVTQIGLDAFADHSEMVVWTTALKDGAPLAV